MYHKVAKNVRALHEFTHKMMMNCPSSSGAIVTSYVVDMPGHNLEFAQTYNDPILN